VAYIELDFSRLATSRRACAVYSLQRRFCNSRTAQSKRKIAWYAVTAASMLSPLGCISFSEGLGRSIAIRFTVVNAAISSEAQKALAKLQKSSGERASHGPIGSSPLGVVSPGIGSVNDILAPLIDLDQDSADANGQCRKYGDLDQHLDTKCFA
jgi:hypothetical protein